jgi:hypothetical protein
MMAVACKPSYPGGRSRKIVVQQRPRQNTTQKDRQKGKEGREARREGREQEGRPKSMKSQMRKGISQRTAMKSENH